ncbi:MAG: glycerol-3-phosphate dehydrogenase [Gemmatimonadota bacterium]|nr:glycerol-3-phosphate dehydrogenase [Gemmatimonadota bacterium]
MRAPPAPRARERMLSRLADDAFDVLVIGGGVSGVAAARDAARRGLRTGLVEAGDFACGTSSRSSRLIHGGLRYLEHFEFDLVFEASQERRTLLRIAPHLVRPLEFLFPIFEDGRVGRLKLDAGLWLYDALSLFRNIDRHQMLDVDELLAAEPSLRREGLMGGARYYDAQVDDARLVVTTAIGAAEAGAAIANGVEAVQIDTSDWPGHRVRVRERESGAEFEIDALSVVNATGPWTERTLRRAGVSRPARLVPSRGTHIHVPRDRIGHAHAFIFEAPSDRRVMFVLPWREDLTLIGTTDDYHEGPPERVAATSDDVGYLLDATNHLFPNARLGREDVLSAWAGLRPLVAPHDDGDEDRPDPHVGSMSREFEVHEDPPGLFTLMGGKLTSHRAMGEETIDLVVGFLDEAKVKPERRSDTARVPLPGGDFDDLDALGERLGMAAGGRGVSPEGAARLARAYGTRADAVLELIDERPQLASPILEGRPHILAEALWAVRREYALSVEDVLYRRTRVALETRDGVEEAARRVAAIIGPELAWPEGRVRDEIDRAVEARAADDRAVVGG